MAESVLLAGKRGSGKTLGAVGMAARYLKEGRVVATNLNLNVEHLVPAYCETPWYRIPDWPTAEDLIALPPGNPNPTKESKNGLLILDEAATFLASRQWSAEGRQAVINWLVQSRKYGWDLLLIAQHARLIDVAVRDALIEVQGTMRRMDKVQVPVVSSVWKYFTGKPLHFPKIHYVALRYGFQFEAPVADRWFFRGADYFKGYDTLQKIHPDIGQKTTTRMPSAWDLKGSKMSKWDLRRQMAAGGLVIGALVGFAGGYAAHAFKPGEKAAETVDAGVKVRSVVRDGEGGTVVLLSDGKTGRVSQEKHDLSGSRYKVGTTWYGQ